MKILDLKQGSKDWLVWREKGMGSSDAAHLVGRAPWNSPEKLRHVKLAAVKDAPLDPRWSTPVNFAMARGTRLEPMARTEFTLLTGIEMSPACVIHDTIPWLKASLDGLSLDRRSILEIKCMGLEKHKRVLQTGLPPDYYLPQVHHQLLTCGPQVGLCYFVSFHPDLEGLDRLAVCPVQPDLEYQGWLLDRETEFWESIHRDGILPPDLTN